MLHTRMTLTIRDLRLRWPAAEKALETEDEIVITRDGMAVAKLVKFAQPPPGRRRFNSTRHITRMRKILGRKTLPSVDQRLARRRADRLEQT